MGKIPEKNAPITEDSKTIKNSFKGFIKINHCFYFLTFIIKKR